MNKFPHRDVPFACFIGGAVATFWRGAWYAMDVALFPDDVKASCVSCLAAGFGGFAALHTALPHLAHAPSPAKFLGVYAAALANVFAWRGTWLAWDIAHAVVTAAPADDAAPPPPQAEVEAERRKVLQSAVASHVVGTALLVGTAHFTSTFAPPARLCVLSDHLRWTNRPSKYLEDIAMFVNKPY